MVMRDIAIGDNILDSRDVIKKYEELQDELESYMQAVEDAYQEWDSNREDEALLEALKQSVASMQDWSDWDDYKIWKEFCEEGESLSDWTYGETLILDEYFQTYAKELALDMGMTTRDSDTYFNYEKFAEDIQSDYTAIEIDGTTYLARS